MSYKTGSCSSRRFFMPKTKIIATYGPAMAGESFIRKMMEAGLDVVRFNCSHWSFRR